MKWKSDEYDKLFDQVLVELNPATKPEVSRTDGDG